VVDKNPEIKIYAPPRFKATWRKLQEICERDGQSASEIARILIEGYVRQRDPGNPQRPLTAWTPGHRDEEARQAQDIFAWLAEYAEERGGWVPYREILTALRDSGVPPARRPDLADDLARRLSRAGVRVLR